MRAMKCVLRCILMTIAEQAFPHGVAAFAAVMHNRRFTGAARHGQTVA
jgi:hypothetical protein